MGPLIYNIHSNDLLYCIMNQCDVYNYADDNTVGCVGDTIVNVREKLENVSKIMIDWFDINHMKANLSKFQYIVFRNSPKPDEIELLNVNNVIIEAQSYVKLLGVNVDSKLNFSKHISELCVKAGRKMNVIARLSAIMDSQSKMLLYNSFVMSHLNFCPIVWHYCNRSDKMKLEKLQYRALKYVDRDFSSSYCELRKRYDKPLLYINRLRAIVSEVYKCVYKTNPTYLNDKFVFNDHNYETRGTMKLKLPKYRTFKFGRASFTYNGTSLWNILDEESRNATCFKHFKQLIRNWNGPTCSCSSCDICVLNNI